MYITSSHAEVQTPTHWNMISRPDDGLAFCVIAQQNSSFTLVSSIAP